MTKVDSVVFIEFNFQGKKKTFNRGYHIVQQDDFKSQDRCKVNYFPQSQMKLSICMICPRNMFSPGLALWLLRALQLWQFLFDLPFQKTSHFDSPASFTPGKYILVLFAISSLLRDRYLIQISFAFKEKYIMYSHRLGNTARTVWKILSVGVTMIQ